MSITIDTARSLLIGAARERYNADQQRQETLTGKPAIPVSSDTALIAASPPLAQELQALNAKEDSLTDYNTGSAARNNADNNSGSVPTDNNANAAPGAVNINNDSLIPDQLKKKLNIVA